MKQSLIKELKQAGQDYEFYPTTEEILNAVCNNLFSGWEDECYFECSLLDIGAGNGSSLSYIRESMKKRCEHKKKRFEMSLYAIELSQILIKQMPSDILTIGTNFWEQNLYDKSYTIFCNPPYKEYKNWMKKILQETNNETYFVVPERWNKDNEIMSLVKNRGFDILGKFDFLDGDRQARAKVDLIAVYLETDKSHNRVDPFKVWFEKEIGSFDKNEFESSIEDEKRKKAETQDRISKQVTAGRSYVDVLIEQYNAEAKQYFDDYKAIFNISSRVAEIIEISNKDYVEMLEKDIKDLKNRYWLLLVDELAAITSKLTSKARNVIIEQVTLAHNIDFTKSNAEALISWILKNAFKYFDLQIVWFWEKLLNKTSFESYKSNKKVFVEDLSHWEWRDNLQKAVNIKLMHRIVCSGFYVEEWSCKDRFKILLEDLSVVANNLGFFNKIDERHSEYEYGKNYSQWCLDGSDHYELVSWKIFKNGNVHFKFNPKFMCKLNVIYGKLKGWLHSPKQASEELDLSVSECENVFEHKTLLDFNTTKLLG